MLHLEIITPEKTVFDAEAMSVTLPTSEGEITVLEMHLPLITTLAPGSLVIRAEGKEEQVFAVARGVIEVNKHAIRVLSDIADRVEELEEGAVEKAKADAEKLMNEKRQDAELFADATAIFERELARLKTVRRHRQRTPLSVHTPGLGQCNRKKTAPKRFRHHGLHMEYRNNSDSSLQFPHACSDAAAHISMNTGGRHQHFCFLVL